jgi:hypothetical protein
MRSASWIACIALACVCWNSPALAKPTPAGAGSPRAAWDQAKDAYRRGDFRTYINTVAPETRDECLCQMSWILSLAIGAEAIDADDGLDDLNEILSKFGVLNAEASAHRAEHLKAPGLWGRDAIGRIQDKVGLYHAVMRYVRKEKVGPVLPSLFMLEPGEVTEGGSRATAPLTGNPRLRTEAKQIAFERRHGRWFVRMPPICLNDMPAVDHPWSEADGL